LGGAPSSLGRPMHPINVTFTIIFNHPVTTLR
jgi:hypothetical protein